MVCTIHIHIQLIQTYIPTMVPVHVYTCTCMYMYVYIYMYMAYSHCIPSKFSTGTYCGWSYIVFENEFQEWGGTLHPASTKRGRPLQGSCYVHYQFGLHKPSTTDPLPEISLHIIGLSIRILSHHNDILQGNALGCSYKPVRMITIPYYNH